MPVLSALYYPLGRSSLHNFRDGILPTGLLFFSSVPSLVVVKKRIWSQHRRGEDTILTSLYLTYRFGKLPHTSSLMIKQAGI